MLTLTNLTKRYGKFLAVDDLSLEVRSGELFGFLGPNGAGKTSLDAGNGQARFGTGQAGFGCKFK